MLVGINGPKGSGKNTVADILVKNHGFTSLGFADKLKESFAALFGITVDDIEIIKNDPSARVSISWHDYDNSGHERFFERSLSGRKALQKYGTESHRDVFGYNFWVDMLLNRENSHLFQGNVAIYDARFDNELKAIKANGGMIVQVRRPGYDFDPSHLSEHAPDPELIDHIIYNNSTLEWLEVAVKDLVRSEIPVAPHQSGDLDSLFQSPLLPPGLSS